MEENRQDRTLKDIAESLGHLVSIEEKRLAVENQLLTLWREYFALVNMPVGFAVKEKSLGEKK
jgi:hypothetical protein